MTTCIKKKQHASIWNEFRTALSLKKTHNAKYLACMMIGFAATWIWNYYYLLNASNVRSVKMIFFDKKREPTPGSTKGSYY